MYIVIQNYNTYMCPESPGARKNFGNGYKNEIHKNPF